MSAASPEKPKITPEAFADARQAIAQLSPEHQEALKNAAPYAVALLLENESAESAAILAQLKTLCPDAVEALDALAKLP